LLQSAKGKTAAAEVGLFGCTADNTLLTSEKIGLIPAQRKCSLPVRGRQALNEVSLVKAVNECAQCGANLTEPEWSEHFPDHRTRNVWSCETCGYEFEDTVYWSQRELADAD
jgi:hypothetical protein